MAKEIIPKGLEKLLSELIVKSLVANEKDLARIQEAVADKFGLERPDLTALIAKVQEVKNVDEESAKQIIRHDLTLLKIAFIIA